MPAFRHPLRSAVKLLGMDQFLRSAGAAAPAAVARIAETKAPPVVRVPVRARNTAIPFRRVAYAAAVIGRATRGTIEMTRPSPGPSKGRATHA